MKVRPTDWRGRDVAVVHTDDGRFYIRQGRRVASVTTIIKRIYPHLFANVNAITLEHARQRGEEVHRALALLWGAKVNHTLDWDSLDPEVRPRVRLINAWLLDNEWVPVHVERSFFSTTYDIGGTPDQVGSFGEDPGMHVLDFKPLDALTADIQLAGYSICVTESLGLVTPPRRITLNVNAKKIQPIEYERHGRDQAEFLNALGAYSYGIRKGMWK